MTAPQTTTIPLPLDIERHYTSSDGTVGVTMRFNSNEEALRVISQVKENIIQNARRI